MYYRENIIYEVVVSDESPYKQTYIKNKKKK